MPRMHHDTVSLRAQYVTTNKSSVSEDLDIDLRYDFKTIGCHSPRVIDIVGTSYLKGSARERPSTVS
jgi:hypothetical protein